VIGYRTDEFPAFWSRTSGMPVPHRVETAAEIGAIASAAWSHGWVGGLLVANPIPASDEIPAAEIAAAIETGLATAAREGSSGPAATPRILAAIATATALRSIPANLALAVANATLAAEIAVALARR
jgi:pseudouridine-5'-phosphate glycosidase